MGQLELDEDMLELLYLEFVAQRADESFPDEREVFKRKMRHFARNGLKYPPATGLTIVPGKVKQS